LRLNATLRGRRSTEGPQFHLWAGVRISIPGGARGRARYNRSAALRCAGGRIAGIARTRKSVAKREAVPNRGQAAQQTPRDRKDNGRVGQSGAQPGAAATGQRPQGVNRGNKSDSEGTTAQERRIPPGLQGNASGQRQLSEEQRTHIRQTLIDAGGARRVSHVDFDVRVGAQIGRGRIHLIQVPDTLVQIDPESEGFLYFVYEDEIVVVDPNDMEIVAILPV